jgi:hypothetical protein
LDLEMRARHRLEMQVDRRRDMYGKRERISMRRSSVSLSIRFRPPLVFPEELSTIIRVWLACAAAEEGGAVKRRMLLGTEGILDPQRNGLTRGAAQGNEGRWASVTLPVRDWQLGFGCEVRWENHEFISKSKYTAQPHDPAILGFGFSFLGVVEAAGGRRVTVLGCWVEEVIVVGYRGGWGGWGAITAVGGRWQRVGLKG